MKAASRRISPLTHCLIYLFSLAESKPHSSGQTLLKNVVQPCFNIVF